MGDTTVRVELPPQAVFEHLTRHIDEANPGPLRVGDQFRVGGSSETFTVTLVEPPNRFGYSVLTGDTTTAVEYSIMPDGGGSIVRAEVDQRSPSTPLVSMMLGSLLEGRTEKKLLEELRATIESAPR